MKTKDLTKIALMVAILSISAYISIPLPFTAASFTAQTLVVNLMGLILTPFQTVMTMIVYIIIGSIGIPVFSGGTSGFGKLFGPTGGFIFGFLVAAVLISILKGKQNSKIRYMIVTIGIGVPIIYTLGAVGMHFATGMGWRETIVSAVIPFIPLDIFKCIVASLIAVPLNKTLMKLGVNEENARSIYSRRT